MFNLKKRKIEKVPQNLDELLERFESLEKRNKEIEERLEKIDKKKEEFLQNIGVVRFNPFSDGGGNQSFSIAILNNNGNGVVVTSLYSKEGNRVYAKPIKKETSEYSLSEEEEKAIRISKENHEQK